MAAPASWRLVGRTVELERIARARSEGRAGIVVYGPPGLGKSRLARQALARAQDEGARIDWVQATRSAASVPLGAFAPLIHRRSAPTTRSSLCSAASRRCATRPRLAADRARRRAVASCTRSDLGGVGEARRLAAPLAELRERCDPRLVAAYAGRAAGEGSALMATADERAGVGALRYATEAAADAAPPFLRAGRQDSARRAAARSRELFVEHQGAARPVIEGLDRSAIDLTARETELVALASEGLTNTQIAERLVLSVRTVESHLYRAMQKLGSVTAGTCERVAVVTRAANAVGRY